MEESERLEGFEMRESLFRGKRADNGEWIEGFLVKKFDKWYIYDFDFLPYSSEITPETAGQYTGLTDKNGKKIFEGDIIEYDKDGARYEVVFAVEDGISKFCSKDLIDGNLGYVNQSRDKVIGNIHDNPELLK